MPEPSPSPFDLAPGGPPDPATNLEFWGRDRASLGRSRALTIVDRMRGDPRVGVVALLIVALVVGLVWYRMGAAVPARSSARSSSSPGRRETRSPTTTTTTAVVVVHVAGAVAHPGVVRLAIGSRVVDAVEAVGGARPGADLDQLNLAAKVVDGQRIAVGVPGSAPAGPVGGVIDGAGAEASAAPVNLNSATSAELEELPGIGPTLAAAILRERDRRGGFRSVDELRSVRGIGEKRFADLRDLVTV